MDLRSEAENRAKIIQINQTNTTKNRHSYPQYYTDSKVDAIPEDAENETPFIAKLAEIDYKWNGTRARVNTGEFVPPRWIPDEAIPNCIGCTIEFDLFNRKHHCRYCGNIFCDKCSEKKLLLPIEFGYKDPERVCHNCYTILLPMQSFFLTNIANHQRSNPISIVSEENCNTRRYFNMPFSLTLGSEIRKASYSIYNLFNLQYINDKSIPLKLLSQAKGVAFITMLKGGFIFAPRIGTGLVISRFGEYWSAPTAIAAFGLSWGAIIGADITDYVIILNTEEAVKAFSGYGQLSIGAGIEVAVGPVGRSGSADIHISDTGMAPAYSYSHSRGLFAGVSLDGSIITARSDVNHNFYGRAVTPMEILTGHVPPPKAGEPLYTALSEALSSLPDVHHAMPSPIITKNSITGYPSLDTAHMNRSAQKPSYYHDDMHIVSNKSNSIL